MAWIEMFRPHLPALVALAVALGSAFAARSAGRPLLAGAAAGIGVLAGWWFAFGLLTATPRQLPERLPLLMLLLVLLAPLAGVPARRWPWLALPLGIAGALLAGWWMAGAPRLLPDLARAWPVLAGVSAATLALALAGAPRWALPLAAAALAGGLAGAALPGPGLVLGGALLAGAAGAALVPPGKGARAATILAGLPVAGGVAALAAIPVIARGAPADWAAAAAPLLALLAGAPAGARLLRRHGAPIGAALAGGAAAGAAFLLR